MWVFYVPLFVVAAMAWVVPLLPFGRLWRRAQRKGYRGPAVPAVLIAIPMLVFGGALAALLVFADDLAVDDGVLILLVWAGMLGVEAVAALIALLVVTLLPERRHRPEGVRKVRLPFRALGRLALVLAVVAPVVWLIARPEDWKTAIRLPLVLVPIAFFCLSAANRKDKPVRDAPLLADPRAPVLYMRGFAQEQTPFARRPDDPRDVAAGRVLDALNAQQRKYATFEEYLEPTVRGALGPWYGLGNPSDYLPPHGIVRFYTGDGEWRARFTELVEASVCVIAVPGSWPNLTWELYTVKKVKAQQRLFLLTPPVAGPWKSRFGRWAAWLAGTRQDTWQDFTAAAAVPDPKEDVIAEYELGGDPGPGAVVTFDEQARAIVLVRGAATPADYITAIRKQLAASTAQEG